VNRRHPSDAVSGIGDDAGLLHFENPLGTRIFEAAFWRIQPRSVRGLVRLHERAHEWRQYVCAAKVMQIVLGWDINFSIWVSSLTVAIYVTLGGGERGWCIVLRFPQFTTFEPL
jgi:hypothetical protein